VELTRLETADTPERYLAAYITDSLSSNIDRIDWAAVDPALATQLSEIGRLGKVPGALMRKGEGLPKVRGFAVEGWRRGFYDSVVVYDPERFLAHATELFRAAPIDRVTFDELNAEQAGELAASGHLARFRSVSFGFKVDAEAVRVLGTHRDAAGVRSIEFDESANGDHLDALAAGKHWTGVRELHLIDLESSDDPPEPEQFADLFARPWCREVRELVAWGCRLDAGAARALATKCPELRHLDIGMNDIGVAGARALAESKSLRRLAFLDVSACDLESGDVQAALITSPRLQALSVLRAGGNGLVGPSEGAGPWGARPRVARARVERLFERRGERARGVPGAVRPVHAHLRRRRARRHRRGPVLPPRRAGPPRIPRRVVQRHRRGGHEGARRVARCGQLAVAEPERKRTHSRGRERADRQPAPEEPAALRSHRARRRKTQEPLRKGDAMSDGPALRAAICANPDDDTARLVYADWLDEHGNPKRAAYIRDKIEQHRFETEDSAANTLSEFLEYLPETGQERIDWAATDSALGAHRTAARRFEKLRSPLSYKGEGVPRVKGAEVSGWVRGFYYHVRVTDGDRFLARADELFRAAPITSIDFQSFTGEQARDFVNAGHLARVRELEFGSDIAAEALRAFGVHRDAAGVHTLDFGGNGTTDQITALAAGKHWTGLHTFSLFDAEGEDGGPTGDELAELFARPWFRGVRKLKAWACGLSADNVGVIARNCPELRELDVALNPIRAAGATALAESKTLRNLRHLDVGSCDINNGEALATLMISPKLPALAVLKANNNYARGASAKGLARPGRGPGLRALELSELGWRAAEALAANPAFAGLWSLGMGGCELGDGGVEQFCRGAAFERLTMLDVSRTHFGSAGAQALAAWPGAASLQWLDVSGNTIGAAGARALIESPHLTNLKYLAADGRGASALKKHFKKAMR
jgi:uncharacterized protein (TIGR02996 family)